MLRTCAAFVMCFFFSVKTHGDITYVSQIRTVSAWADASGGIDPQHASISAPDFNDFDETLTVTSSYFWPKFDQTFEISGIASQTSALNESGLSVVGNAMGNEGPPAGSSFSRGSTLFDVTFEVATPTGFHLIALFDGFGDYSLTGPSWDYVFDGEPSFEPINLSLDISGVLQPGQYRIYWFGDERGEVTYLNEYQLFLATVPAQPTLLALGAIIVVFQRRQRVR